MSFPGTMYKPKPFSQVKHFSYNSDELDLIPNAVTAKVLRLIFFLSSSGTWEFY